MTKVTNKIAICLLLGLGFLPLSAYSNNSLTQLDIKKSVSSDSALNVTIYTSSPYDDNVAVSKKSDNKYVILMPNVSGASQSLPDLSGLQDIVSNIDVKSVQDGENGYTKVTLTTTKPVTIRTATKRSAPLTAEQKAYKNLIAQSRANKPVTASNNTIASTTIKFENNTKDNVKPVKETAAPVPAKQEVKPVNFNDSTNNDNNIKTAQEKVEATTSKTLQEPELVKEVQPVIAEKNTDTVINNELQTVLPEADSLNVKPEKQALLSNKVNQFQNRINKGFSSDMLTSFAILICSILGLTILFRLIRKSVEHSNVLKNSFKENLSQKPSEVKGYDDIVNNSDMNWQEKYQKFVRNAMPAGYQPGVIRQVDSGEYKFAAQVKPVNTPKNSDSQTNNIMQTGFAENMQEVSGNARLKPDRANKLTSYNKTAKNISPENIPPIKKVKNQELKSDKPQKLQAVQTRKVEHDYKELEESLERTLHQAPDLDEIKFDEEAILKQMQVNFNTVPVVSETDKIADAMHKTRKLKSFANKMALEETRRNAPLPKMRSEIKKSRNIESKHVELGSHSLHTNPRKFEGGNLSVGDLIAKSDKFNISPNKTNKQMNLSFENKEYSTITIDEFFDKIDYSSSVTAPASLASKVADSLGKMSVDMDVKKIQKTVQAKSNPFKGMIVQSGYNINEDSGFYIVRNKDGRTSLIGRINNDMTLLKDFGTETDVKLQVRMDNANVYMVKANGYRYLVEVNNNKMGVLLEL